MRSFHQESRCRRRLAGTSARFDLRSRICASIRRTWLSQPSMGSDLACSVQSILRPISPRCVYPLPGQCQHRWARARTRWYRSGERDSTGSTEHGPVALAASEELVPRIRDTTQFSSIELLSLEGGRCSPPSSLEYAPIGAQSKQEGGCVSSPCTCGRGDDPSAPPACAAIAQSPFCPTHSIWRFIRNAGRGSCLW